MRTGIAAILMLFSMSFSVMGADTLGKAFVRIPEGADMAIYSMYKEYLGKDQDKSMEYAELFLSGLDTNARDPELGRMCDQLGEWYEVNNLYTSALDWRKKALDQYMSENMESEVAESRYYLARLYYRKGEYHKSLEYLMEILPYFHEVRDSMFVMECHNLLGSVYYACGDYSRAYEYFQMYAQEAEQFGDSLRRCVALNNIAAYYSVMLDTAKIGALIGEAIKISREMKDSSMLCSSLLNYSSFQINDGRYDEAAESLRSARPLLSDDSQRGSYWLNWSILLRKTGDVAAACDSMKRAEEILAAAESDEDLRRCYNIMIENYSLLSDSAAMYEAAWKYHEVAERIFSKETSLQLFQYQNEMIRQKEAEKVMEEKALKKVYISVSLSILAVLGMGAWLYGRNRSFMVRQKQDELERQILLNRQNEQELRSKNEILEMKKLEQYKTERVVMEMTQKFKTLCEETKNQTTCNKIMQICSELRHSMESQMEDVNSFIPEFNSDFFQRLLKAFPNLTINERRLCALLHLNMSTKQISEITRQSPHSINIARGRLREKLGLKGSRQSLQEFLSTFE